MTEESTNPTNEENSTVEKKREILTLPKKDGEGKEDIASQLENYKKGMLKYKSEKKELEGELAIFKAQQKEAEEKELAEKGEYKKLLEAKQKELADLNSSIEKERASRKKDNLLNKIRLKAQENGANDVDDITRFLNVDELLDSDDEAINEKFNQLKEKKSYLFSDKKKSSASDENNSVFSGGDKKPKSFSDALSMAMKGKAF